MAKKALIIIAQEGYQDREYSGTRKGLEDGGYEVVVASSEAGPCAGKLGGTETAAIAMHDVRTQDYGCIAFIGGPGAAVYAKHPEALRIAHEASELDKPLGAICIAPTILANAGVIRWKKVTVWNEDGKQRDVVEDAGATYTGEDVTVDGKLVTGNGPAAAEKFGKTLAAIR